MAEMKYNSGELDRGEFLVETELTMRKNNILSNLVRSFTDLMNAINNLKWDLNSQEHYYGPGPMLNVDIKRIINDQKAKEQKRIKESAAIKIEVEKLINEKMKDLNEIINSILKGEK